MGNMSNDHRESKWLLESCGYPDMSVWEKCKKRKEVEALKNVDFSICFV